MTLSVCLIVKNEEEVIARCLDCARKFADEIIIADTGSTDKTREIACKYTDKIYDFEWKDDFSAARNFAFDKAVCDYVMWLDADDFVTDENCEKIRRLMECADFDMAFLPYVTAMDEDKPSFEYYRERIMRRSCNYRFKGAVHEAVVPAGKIVYADAQIFHKKIKEGKPLRNLHIYQKMIARGICLDEREKFYYGRELFFNKMYRESIAVFEDFLAGEGWVENKIEACLNLFGAYSALGETDKAYAALIKSFLFAPPRSEACCALGEKFMCENDVKSAIFWYQSAIAAHDGRESGAFVNLDYGGFIPCMQLCVLYDRLGEYQRAAEYNERAGKIKPHNKSYLSNKKYFEDIRGIKTQNDN